MPSQYPPYSTARHTAIEARRMSRGDSRGRSSRDGRDLQYRHQPYVEAQGRRGERMRSIRGHFTAMIGDFVGTTMFLWLALAGTQTAVTLTADTNDAINQTFYVALAFGLSLLVCAWAFYRISGGLFNPAVTIGLCAAGQMPWVRGLFVFPAQILGGMAAAGLVSCMFPGPIAVTQTTLGQGTSITRGVFIEAFGAFILVFTILMLAAEKNHARSVAPVAIGLALFVAELAGVPYTGGSFNPARSFGPAVAVPHFVGYHYIYWFGPIMGALAAAGYFRMNKALHYEEAQPGQDAPRGTAQAPLHKEPPQQTQYAQY